MEQALHRGRHQPPRRGRSWRIALPADKQQIVDRLSGLSGQEFDREYMAAMVEDHQKAVEIFQQASNATDLDAEVKSFAAKTLPALQQHLERAKTVSSSLK